MSDKCKIQPEVYIIEAAVLGPLVWEAMSFSGVGLTFGETWLGGEVHKLSC